MYIMIELCPSIRQLSSFDDLFSALLILTVQHTIILSKLDNGKCLKPLSTFVGNDNDNDDDNNDDARCIFSGLRHSSRQIIFAGNKSSLGGEPRPEGGLCPGGPGKGAPGQVARRGGKPS